MELSSFIIIISWKAHKHFLACNLFGKETALHYIYFRTLMKINFMQFWKWKIKYRKTY